MFSIERFVDLVPDEVLIEIEDAISDAYEAGFFQAWDMGKKGTRFFDGASCVYFIANESGGIKIGYSKTPYKRLAALQTANGDKLHMMRIVIAEDERQARKCEISLHHLFRYVQLNNEWFEKAEVVRWLFGRSDEEILSIAVENRRERT